MELDRLLRDPILMVLIALSLLSYTMAFRLWFSMTQHLLLKWGVGNMTAVDLCRVACPQIPSLHKLIHGPYSTTQQLQTSFDLLRNRCLLGAQQQKKIAVILANVAPLLGLLGTVMGINETFQSLSTVDTLGWSEMSVGISKALLTTQMGLMVALPLYLLLAAIGSQLKALERAILRCEQVAIQVQSSEHQFPVDHESTASPVDVHRSVTT